MKVQSDQATPAPLRRELVGHVVETAYERGWSSLQNGELIAAAESAGFEVIVTTDRKIKYQQNLPARNIGVVVLLTTSWPRIQRALPEVRAAVEGAVSSRYIEVTIA